MESCCWNPTMILAFRYDDPALDEVYEGFRLIAKWENIIRLNLIWSNITKIPCTYLSVRSSSSSSAKRFEKTYQPYFIKSSCSLTKRNSSSKHNSLVSIVVESGIVTSKSNSIQTLSANRMFTIVDTTFLCCWLCWVIATKHQRNNTFRKAAYYFSLHK